MRCSPRVSKGPPILFSSRNHFLSQIRPWVTSATAHHIAPFQNHPSVTLRCSHCKLNHHLYHAPPPPPNAIKVPPPPNQLNTRSIPELFSALPKPALLQNQAPQRPGGICDSKASGMHQPLQHVSHCQQLAIMELKNNRIQPGPLFHIRSWILTSRNHNSSKFQPVASTQNHKNLLRSSTSHKLQESNAACNPKQLIDRRNVAMAMMPWRARMCARVCLSERRAQNRRLHVGVFIDFW